MQICIYVPFLSELISAKNWLTALHISFITMEQVQIVSDNLCCDSSDIMTLKWWEINYEKYIILIMELLQGMEIHVWKLIIIFDFHISMHHGMNGLRPNWHDVFETTNIRWLTSGQILHSQKLGLYAKGYMVTRKRIIASFGGQPISLGQQ